MSRIKGQNFMMKGFTFIELILYIAIISIVMTAIIPFAWNVIEGAAKSSTQQEVYSQARFISERLKYEIRNASGINSVTASQISLSESTAAVNPTIIDLLSGNIRIKQGLGSAINLNSANTTISALTFTNYSSGDNKTKHVRLNFTVNAAFGSTRQEYTDSTTIDSSAEIRTN